MEQSKSTKMTPYELATLASRIFRQQCIVNPKGAIAAAERLLNEATYALARAEAEDRKNEEENKAYQEGYSQVSIDWARGIKDITRERRRDRATQRFTKFMRHGAPADEKGKLSLYKRNGFSLDELWWLERLFAEWQQQPKRPKGRQGRRISKNDGRLRAGVFRLVARKPRKPI